MILSATGFTAGDAASITGEHTAPADLTVDQAHRQMQIHLSCATTTCEARRTALALLVAQERYLLDPSPQRR